MRAKAHGARNLDLATRNSTTLEHFVMWSSIVAVAGNEGEHADWFTLCSNLRLLLCSDMPGTLAHHQIILQVRT